MTSTLSNAAGILNALIVLLLLVGGYIALRSGKFQRAGEIQEQVINALKAELETLQRRMDDLERENMRLHRALSLIKTALKKRGLTLSVDNDFITIDDRQANSQYGDIQEEGGK